MFRRVLVATDFSAHADAMLECIGQIPGMEEILLVTVINGSGPGNGLLQKSRSPRDLAQEALEKKGRALEQEIGIPVSPRVEEAEKGDTAGAIIALAHRETIPLIVMGGRGKGLLAGFILGSVSEGVIRRSNTDVLIMHFRAAEGGAHLEKFCRNVFSHVLCPVDFSRPAEKTLEYARSLGFIRRITLVHVMKEGHTGGNGDRVQEIRKKLSALEEGLASAGIRADSLLRTGSPAREIARAAEELDVSLIMLARFGQSDYIRNVSIGSITDAVAMHAGRPLFIVNPHISLAITAREMVPAEFPLAEGIWLGYHQQKADPATDRVFGVFAENVLVAAARCRRHPDGLEVDAVYTPDQYRGRGYARLVMKGLTDACGTEPLFMHSTLDLIGFYGTFGFHAIAESQLPPSIRERFGFAEGDLEGANVQPMCRPPYRASGPAPGS